MGHNLLVGKARLIRTFLLALALFSAPAFAQSVNQTGYDNTPQGGQLGQKVDSGTHPLPVSISGGGSPTTPTVVYQKNIGTTTYTKTAVTLTGSSQTVLAASTTRVAFSIYNPSTNANVWVDISGGTIAAEGGSLIAPGWTFSVTGSATPKTLITMIGTSTQSVIVEEGN